MKLKNLFKKKNSTNTGLRNIEKIEFKGKIQYKFTKGNTSKFMSDLDFFLSSLEYDGETIIVEDEDLFNESILESRRNSYQDQCDVMGIENDKDPDSFYHLYSEWPIPDGKWTIWRFDGRQSFTIRRKDKESVMSLVDDLNNGRPYPYKIIENKR